MKLWKDKSGVRIESKDFFKRLKQGAAAITPEQIYPYNLLGQTIMIVGILWGIWSTYYYTDMNWLIMILIGSLLITCIQWFSTYGMMVKIARLKEMAGDEGYF